MEISTAVKFFSDEELWQIFNRSGCLGHFNSWLSRVRGSRKPCCERQEVLDQESLRYGGKEVLCIGGGLGKKTIWAGDCLDGLKAKLSERSPKKHEPESMEEVQGHNEPSTGCNLTSSFIGSFTDNGVNLDAEGGSMKENQHSPYGCALYLARRIENREDDVTEVQEAVRALGEQDQKRLTFQLATECLRLRVELPAVFAVAYAARIMPVAHATGSICKAMRADNLGLAGLVKAGLLQIKFSSRNGREVERFVPHLGHQAMREAIVILREENNAGAAKELERHLAYGEERKLVSEARRAAKAVESEPEKSAGEDEKHQASQPEMVATRAAQDFAKNAGVDIAQVQGSGKDGRIIVTDVKTAIAL